MDDLGTAKMLAEEVLSLFELAYDSNINVKYSTGIIPKSIIILSLYFNNILFRNT